MTPLQEAGIKKLLHQKLGYNHIIRARATVNHGEHEWAHDDDGDGIWEVHINTAEGMWTGVRIFLHPFKGVHKRFEWLCRDSRVPPQSQAHLTCFHRFVSGSAHC